jgi:hypothetical protein
MRLAIKVTKAANKDVWIALVDFYCGLNEQQKLHCVTVLVFDPSTNEHRFMTPDQLSCLLSTGKPAGTRLYPQSLRENLQAYCRILRDLSTRKQ